MNSKNQTKHLKDLLLKYQQNSRFRAAPSQHNAQNCNCNLKQCSICIKKRSVVNASPLLKIKNQPSSRREIKFQNSISIHQSPNRERKPQQQLMLNQSKSKNPTPQKFYQNFLNNYYNINSQKQSESKSHILSSTQASFKLNRSRQLKQPQRVQKPQSKSEQMLIQGFSECESLRADPITKTHFKFLYVIGKGGFGRVWKCELKRSRSYFAVKEMSKAKVIQKRSVNSVLNEKFLLEHLHHPFLVNIHYAFQDRENLYLVIDLLTGGDLRFHIGKMRRFSENQSKFFIASLLLALSYLHEHGIIHRDIKPENLVLDCDGYIRLTDLGIARVNKGNNAGDTSGTPGYMAPEVMCRMDHSVVSDYFAVGVIAYELMLGRRPYNGRSRQEIREQILAKQIQIKQEELPFGWSEQAIDFINQLIQRKPERRLGVNGIHEITQHTWLKHYPWDDLAKKKIQAMYVPGVIDDKVEFQNQLSEETVLNDDQLLENQMLIRRETVQALFEEYQYDSALKSQQKSQKSTTQRRSQPISS